MKKYSILGLTLLAVSAVTAAFIPAKSNNGQAVTNGHMTQSTGGQLDQTCRKPNLGDVQDCSWTETRNNAAVDGFSSTSANVLGSNSDTIFNSIYTASETEGA